LISIDEKNKNKIKSLLNKNNEHNIKRDIVYEMYNEHELNSERLQFIIENCTPYLNISSPLIKKLMKDNNRNLLELLFKNHFKFFDNIFIINLLNVYKNKTAMSYSDLYTFVNNDKYKLSTKWNENFTLYNSSCYLFNACESGNEAAVKFLLKHGADMSRKDKNNRIAITRACKSGNLHLVKYLVHLGADINNEDNFGFTPLFDGCSMGNLNIVKYLVELGANINKENKYRCNSLNFCLSKWTYHCSKIFSGTWSRYK